MTTETITPASSLVGFTTVGALSRAWEHVRANDAEDGHLSASVRRFARNADERIATLHAEFCNGTYRPRPLTSVPIEKESGGTRVLHIGAARDRVVERALAAGLAPRLDPLFEPASFGYRAGIGVGDAVRHLCRLRDEGLAWVARTDIDDCFPTIDRDRLMVMLAVCVPDRRWLLWSRPWCDASFAATHVGILAVSDWPREALFHRFFRIFT